MISEEKLWKIVEHYKENFEVKNLAELNYFKGMTSLKKVIDRAAFANYHGKRFNHQRRFTKCTLREAYIKLREMRNIIEACKDFDELHTLLIHEVEPIHGIGELYCYDTAQRIGVYLGLLPEKVYLHRGTRDGAKILMGHIDKKQKTIEITNTLGPLNELEPHQIEDVLCIYREDMIERVIRVDDIKLYN